MTSPRPSHLSPTNAARFQAPDVVGAYPHRLPYPEEVFDILIELVEQSVAAGDAARAVVDVGTGDGSISRHLAARSPAVTRVDALDISAPMLALAQSLPGGASPAIRWMLGPAESAPLDPPYALATAGESLHWMDWEVTLPRLADALAPHGMLAILERGPVGQPWKSAVAAVIRRYSTMRDYEEYDLVGLLTERGLFAQAGARATAPVSFTQPVAEYIEALHSFSSLARSVMSAADAAACDAELRAILAPYADADGLLHLEAVAQIVWGRPLGGGGGSDCGQA